MHYATQSKPHAVSLGDGVYWIGALDPKLRQFDIILRTANGTTYNAYLVRGETGVAIIDTVKLEFADVFFERLESVADYSEISVIVLNHLEPDHAGALPELLRRAPQAKIYLSVRAPAMLKAFLKVEDGELNYIPVNTGDEVDLGHRTLHFINAPYLHWPDTQFTYLVEKQMLFSGDAFGCHFCDDRLFDDEVGDFRFAFDYYYAHIMRPFKEHVLNAVDRLQNLPISQVMPAHGPILRTRPSEAIQRYRELSTTLFRTPLAHNEKSLLIFYMSSYGNTAKMAEAIAKGAEKIEGVKVSIYDLEGGEVTPFIDLIEHADGLLFGSPTINGDAVKPIWDLLSSLAVIRTAGKLAAAFGSYGWSGEAVPMMEDRLRGLKMRVPEKGLRLKLIPNQDELGECEAFGSRIAETLMGRQKPKVLTLADLR